MPKRKPKFFNDGLSVELDKCNCPWCGQLHDAATHSGSTVEVPEPGNLSLCVHCGGVAVFTGDLKLRRPTKAEQREIDNSPTVKRAVAAWRNVFKPDSRDA